MQIQRVKKRDNGTARQRDRDNALPFMPFYDALCPLVPDNEKGQKGSQGAEGAERVKTKVRVNTLPFMTFYALWYPRMRKGRKVRDRETKRGQVSKKIEATERIYTLTQPASPNLKKSLRPVLNLSIGLSNLKLLT